MSSQFDDPRLMEIGDAAEAVAVAFLRALPHVRQVRDVTRDATWQAREIDLRVEDARGAWHGIEVKSDRHIARTGNVLFELVRVHHSAPVCAYLGWGVFSQAAWLFVWCPPAERLYTFNVTALREAFQRHTAAERSKLRLSVVPTDARRTTINVLVPLALVPHTAYVRVGAGWERAS